jgi:DNA-binding transcriptional MerR regulator
MSTDKELPTPIRPTMHIGELARRTGRSVHTIRWYESIGLVPGVRRDVGNRRVYDELHVGWLDLMHRLRFTGMSITQMRKYAALVSRGHVTLEARRDMLIEHRTRVEATTVEWGRALSLVEAKIDFYENWLSTGHRPLGVRSMQSTTRKARKA